MTSRDELHSIVLQGQYEREQSLIESEQSILSWCVQRAKESAKEGHNFVIVDLKIFPLFDVIGRSRLKQLLIQNFQDCKITEEIGYAVFRISYD